MGNITTTTFTNWNGSWKCHPSRVEYPRNEEDLRKIVQRCCKQKGKKKRLRVVGGAVHTYGFLSMCDAGDVIVSLKNYNRIIKVDRQNKTITAEAGIALENLVKTLEDKSVRLALLNMGEISEQSLGGVTATGTHGSGGGRSGVADSFSDQVLAYKIMECTPEAQVRVIQRGDADFDAFMTHLGALAIVLEVTLQLVDWYHLEWKPADIGNVKNLTIDLMKQKQSQVYSVAYSYFPSTDEVVELVRDTTNDTFESGIASDVLDDFVSTLRQGATRWLRLCPYGIEDYARVQQRALLSLKGSDMWRKVLSQGDLWGGVNLTIMTDLEYAVPIHKAIAALSEIRKVLLNDYKNVLSVVAIRFVQGSNALLACHYDTSPDQVYAYVNVQLRTKKPDLQVINKIQSNVMALGGRPHWGKYNTTTRDMIEKNELWPTENLNAFLEVKARYDPNNILGNAYLDRALGLV